MNHICFNGNILSADEPVLLASNRGYRYGDGLFETIKVAKGQILFAGDHFERLFTGLALLQFEIPARFTKEQLAHDILRLCQKNDCAELARVRLSVSRGYGGLYDTDRKLNWLLECWALNNSVNQLNENGLVTGIYPDARKSCDKFSNLKSANFLPYSMAAQYAKDNKWNDCLVLNTNENIADSAIANVFIVTKTTISTPALTEGCISGIMRKNILVWLRQEGYTVNETTISARDIHNADELFLTNAINGIRWVGRCGEKQYTNNRVAEIYKGFAQTIPA
jgi:branched-chain amino acid aminotransferase